MDGWPSGMCCSSMSECWYEPSWSVNCGPNLIRLIAKRYAQIVSDVSGVALEVNIKMTTNKVKKSLYNVYSYIDVKMIETEVSCSPLCSLTFLHKFIKSWCILEEYLMNCMYTYKAMADFVVDTSFYIVSFTLITHYTSPLKSKEESRVIYK